MYRRLDVLHRLALLDNCIRLAYCANRLPLCIDPPCLPRGGTGSTTTGASLVVLKQERTLQHAVSTIRTSTQRIPRFREYLGIEMSIRRPVVTQSLFAKPNGRRWRQCPAGSVPSVRIDVTLPTSATSSSPGPRAADARHERTRANLDTTLSECRR